MGFTLCPHVARDCYIVDCNPEKPWALCKFKITGIPEVMWLGTREEGKCLFCEFEETDTKEKERKKRWVMSKLDLFENYMMNTSDTTDTSDEIHLSDRLLASKSLLVAQRICYA